MKKHNEGYTLVLVLVVILVLAACATAVLSFSVQNLKTQQRMVERMQAKYEAQGEIEQIAAQLVRTDEYTYTPGLGQDESKKLQNMIAEWMAENSDIQTVQDIVIKTENGVNTFSCVAALKTDKISTEIELTGNITKKDINQGAKEVYTISNLKIAYRKYSYSTVTASEGGSGE